MIDLETYLIKFNKELTTPVNNSIKKEDREDVQQTIALRLLDLNNKGKLIENKGWAYTVASNVCKDYIKTETMTAEAEKHYKSSTEIYDPAELVISLDYSNGIESLPEKYRDVVNLRVVHNKSYAEISKMLSLPVGTVSSRLSRGLELLGEYND